MIVHAGAVGPHESGEGYVPSWNLITLAVCEEQLHVRIEPRVWLANETAFGPHDDGTAEFQVAIGESLPDQDGATSPGSSATALPDDLLSTAPTVESADQRLDLRRTAVSFMQLAPTQRVALARTLGIAEGLTDGQLSSAKARPDVSTWATYERGMLAMSPVAWL